MADWPDDHWRRIWSWDSDCTTQPTTHYWSLNKTSSDLRLKTI